MVRVVSPGCPRGQGGPGGLGCTVSLCGQGVTGGQDSPAWSG